MTKTPEMTKLPNQNIDVQFWQTRTPNEWKARIRTSAKEVFVVGPGNIASVMSNVMNLVRTEANYADLYVHPPTEEEIITTSRIPTTWTDLEVLSWIHYKLTDKAQKLSELLNSVNRQSKERVREVVLRAVDDNVLDVGSDYIVRPLYRYCPTCESNVPVDSQGNCAVAPPPICGGTYPLRVGSRIYLPGWE